MYNNILLIIIFIVLQIFRVNSPSFVEKMAFSTNNTTINTTNRSDKFFIDFPSIIEQGNKDNINIYSKKNEIHYSPSQNEWYTSLYSYNKKYIKNSPIKDINTYKLLTSYFNMSIKKSKIFFNKDSEINNNDYSMYVNSDIHEEKSMSELNDSPKKQLLKSLKKRKLKKTRFSVKKTFISKPQNKHLNHKLIITVSIYNRETYLLKKKIFKIFKRLFFKRKISNIKKVLINKHILLKTNITIASCSNVIFGKGLDNKWSITSKKNNITSLIYKFKTSSFDHSSKLLDNSYNQNLNVSLDKSSLLLSKKQKLMKYFIYNKYKHLLIFKHYLLMWSLHNYKFNNNSLIGLRNIVGKIYEKTPYFNFIKLKYFYLDSNIIASLITKKLKDRKKKVLIILKRALSRVKKFRYLSIWNGKFDLNNLVSLYEDENKLLNGNIYSKVESSNSKNMVYYKDFLLRSKKDIVSVILYNTKHKVLNGIRLQGGGRLTKRLTALRAVSKTNYVGSLKDINSSTLGLSTVMLKGYCKSNLQYTNINSYNRNGSFGVKAAIASF